MITLNQDILKIRSSADQVWEGIPAVNGESAFEIAKRVKSLPADMTEEEWLDSLKVVAFKDSLEPTTVANYLTNAITIDGQPTLMNEENSAIINFKTNTDEINDLYLLDNQDWEKIMEQFAVLENRVRTIEQLLKLSDCGILDVNAALKKAY